MSEEIKPATTGNPKASSEQLVPRKKHKREETSSTEEAVIVPPRHQKSLRVSTDDIRSIAAGEAVARDLAERIVSQPIQALDAHAISPASLDLLS